MNALLAVTTYDVSLAIHVMAVMVGFGPTFAFPLIQMTAERRFPRHLPFAWNVIGKTERGIVTPLAVIVGLTGIYQWQDHNWDIGDNQWLAIGFGLYLVLFTFALTLLRRAENAAEAAAEQMVAAAGPTGDVPITDEYRQATRLVNVSGPVLGILTLFIVYLMVVKPF
jgi:uncharacterized membrane protein